MLQILHSVLRADFKDNRISNGAEGKEYTLRVIVFFLELEYLDIIPLQTVSIDSCHLALHDLINFLNSPLDSQRYLLIVYVWRLIERKLVLIDINPPINSGIDHAQMPNHMQLQPWVDTTIFLTRWAQYLNALKLT